jgi:flagellar M-ring protein FliF
MREYLLQLKTQALELWQKMTRIQKIAIVCSAVVLLGTLILLARGATQPDYGVLFTLKDELSANQAREKLIELKIPYKVELTTEGTTILIPAKDIPETRLALAGENIATGGVVGFESFDNTKFGETDTDRRARYLRALQGELTRTIEGMAEVDKARVHIVLPEPSIFLEEQKNATAAIMLKFKPQKSINQSQAKGLVKLVSNSIEGLKAENVTIVDMAGNILSEDLGDDKESKGQKLTMTQVDLQKQYQKEVQSSVQSMLERVVGMGKAVVRLQLELDFDTIQRKKQEYGDKQVRSEQIAEENSTNSTTSDSGAPGTDTNIPGYVTTGGQTGNSTAAKSDRVKNYEIDSLEEIRDVAPGSIKRLSVAVVVDKEIDTKTQKQIEDMVKNATGFSNDRGDQISVAGMPFNTQYQDQMKDELAKAEQRQQMLVYGGIAALALLVIGGVAGSIIVKRRRAQMSDGVISKAIPVKKLPIVEEEVTDILAAMSPEDIERKRLKDQVEKVAKEHPDDIANLLRTWLAEE